MRPVLAGKVTLTELRRSWTVEDLCEIHRAMDAEDEIKTRIAEIVAEEVKRK
jgi:hypothetical protein